MVHFLYHTAVFHLDEFISAVKLRHQNIFPISQSGEGHAQPPGGLQVSVSRKFLQQRVLHHPQQTERWVENTQRVFPRLSRHIQQISTEVLWQSLIITSSSSSHSEDKQHFCLLTQANFSYNGFQVSFYFSMSMLSMLTFDALSCQVHSGYFWVCYTPFILILSDLSRAEVNCVTFMICCCYAVMFLLFRPWCWTHGVCSQLFMNCLCQWTCQLYSNINKTCEIT